jgi:uncharacterized membrane protein HdeD (DUF308 family)
MNDTNLSADPNSSIDSAIRHELVMLHKQWWLLLLLGISLIVLGTVAIGTSFLATVATVVVFGLLLLAGGVAQLVGACWAGKWSGSLVTILIGLLYVVVGYFMVDAPVANALALTLVIAAMLILSGIFRIVAAMSLRFHDWGWPLLSGIVSLLLGVMIYKQWPESGLWVIGTFVGIEMIFNGWTWVMLALGVRAAAQHLE